MGEERWAVAMKNDKGAADQRYNDQNMEYSYTIYFRAESASLSMCTEEGLYDRK